MRRDKFILAANTEDLKIENHNKFKNQVTKTGAERAVPFNPDPIRPMSDDTKVHNMPKVIEPCANAAQAGMPRDEASTMARPESDPPDVASSRQRFVEPTDKLPMTAMAWDKIHIFADMASNKMIKCVQPFRMRKTDENDKGMYDRFYESSADNMIGPMTQIHNIAKDGVAYLSLIHI